MVAGVKKIDHVEIECVLVMAQCARKRPVRVSHWDAAPRSRVLNLTGPLPALECVPATVSSSCASNHRITQEWNRAVPGYDL
jgi:hypothetical protein